MSERQVLSKEEIDKLFVAARSGAEPASERPADSPKRRARRVREIDFSRPSKFSPDTQRRFERAYQAFCRSASTQLGADLRTVLELEVIDLDQLSWSAAVDRLPQPSLYGLIEVEPLGTTVMLALELSLVMRMIDRLLGGTGEIPSTSSDLTEIELAIARRLFATLVAPLSLVWEELLGVTLSLRELEPKLSNVNIAPPSEPTLTITVEATTEGSSETLAMTVPYRAIEAAMEKLAAATYREGAVDPVIRERVQLAVSGAEIDLRVEAAAVTMALDDLLALEVGDVVRLGTDASAGVTLLAGAVPIHHARPGRSGTKRAIEIVDKVRDLR